MLDELISAMNGFLIKLPRVSEKSANAIENLLKRLISEVSSLDTFHQTIPSRFSFAGLAEAARGRGNSHANLPSFRLTTVNVSLVVLITTFISWLRISEMTLLSVHLPLIKS
jgi:hypothetical protein